MGINTYKRMFVLLLLVSLLGILNFAHALSMPQVQTNLATNVQDAQAMLNGNLHNLGEDNYSMVWFQYGTTTSYGYETVHENRIYEGNFSQFVSGLSQNTTYHFRAVTQNGYSTSYGQDVTFNTSQSSGQVVANAGPDIYVSSGQSATLQGSGYNVYGGPVNYSWSCSGGTLSSFAVLHPVYTAPYVQGQANYNCTLTVYNSSYGNSDSDSTAIYVNYVGGSGNFYAQTDSASNVQSHQATLNGRVYGGLIYTTVWFQYGTTTNYGNNSTSQQVNYSGSVSKNIANLSANTTYHYRIVAQNSNGQITYGQDAVFYTGYDYLPPPYGPPPYPPSLYEAGVLDTISKILLLIQQILANLR